MKKFVRVLLLSLLLIVPSQALANDLHEIDLSATIHDDGAMTVDQVWEIYIDQGTEVYIPMQNLNHMDIVDYKVYDEKGNPFQYQGYWDVNASREEKAGKCGINYPDSGGLELCFGVGDYGMRKYRIVFTYKNAVQSFEDMDGFNIRLVNDQMNPAPSQVDYRIRLEDGNLDSENSKIWAFGYEGNIVFEDGQVVGHTDNFDYSSNVTVMMGLEKGLIHPVYEGVGSFDDMRKEAFIGSDYSEEEYNASVGGDAINPNYNYDDNYYDDYEDHPIIEEEYNDNSWERPAFLSALLFIPGLIFRFLPAVIFFLVIGFAISSKKSKIVNLKDIDTSDVGYYREIPLDGFLPAIYTYTDYKKNLKEENLIAAYLLKWIHQGALEVYEKEKTRKILFWTKNSVDTSLHIVDVPELRMDFERELWRFLANAAGSNEILEKNEMERYIKKHTSSFSDLLSQREKDTHEFSTHNGLEEIVKRTMFGNYKYELTAEGIDEYKACLGLYNYLKDFTIIEERSVDEVTLWDDYLIAATLFGYGEQVLEELKRLYPDLVKIENQANSSNMDTFAVYALTNSLARSSMSSYRSATSSTSSSSGGGGFSSSGGGGGFSGGGSGGGVR